MGDYLAREVSIWRASVGLLARLPRRSLPGLGRTARTFPACCNRWRPAEKRRRRTRWQRPVPQNRDPVPLLGTTAGRLIPRSTPLSAAPGAGAGSGQVRAICAICALLRPRFRFRASASALPLPRFRFRASASALPLPRLCVLRRQPGVPSSATGAQ